MGVLLILIVVAALAVALWLALEVNRRRAKRSWEAQREALGDATRDAFRATRHAWLLAPRSGRRHHIHEGVDEHAIAPPP